MSLIGNYIKSQTAGKSGVNNRIYQSFYVILEEKMQKRPGKVSLSTDPLWDTLLRHFFRPQP